MPDIPTAAAERTEAAQRLIDQAQNAEFVELVVVSALELCTLGGPGHPMFDTTVAHAWEQLGNRRRKKIMEWVTEGMVQRGLLIENGPGASRKAGGAAYSLNPALGIALAARCRPAFIVLTETADRTLRTSRFFALGDQAEPVRGIVMENPAALPADAAANFSHVKKFGPLGWFYRYVLFSRDKAAAALAEWAIAPPPQPGTARVVSLYHPRDGHDSVGVRLSVRGDGTKARLDSPGDGGLAEAEYDLAGLRAVMLDLLTLPPQ